jgi:thiol-disulfide isomerase/thioredoxin
VYFRAIFLITRIITTFFIIWMLTISATVFAEPPKDGDMVDFTEEIPPKLASNTPFIGPDGKIITLLDLKGTWVFLNFWATWCAPCIQELPSIYELQKNTINNKLKVLLISIDKSGRQTYEPFLKNLNLRGLESASDPRSKLMRSLKLTGIPTTLLLDPKGRIVGKLIGDANWSSQSAKKLIDYYTTLQ